MPVPRLLVPCSLLALAACVDPPGGSSDVKTEDLPGFSSDTVYGVPNIDDDDRNGEADWEDMGADDENDRVVVDLAGAGAVELTLVGGADTVRIWREGDVLLDEGTLTATVTDGTIEVEFGDFLAFATLTVTSAEDTERSATRELRSAPLLLNNHLQSATRVVAMSETGRMGNEAFIEGFTAALGEVFTPFQLRTYGYDVWVQDEIEFATLSAPGHRMDVVIDSIRTNNDRYLDELAEEELEAPDFAVATWGSGRATSQDSFGNLEVSPPVTVDGVEYPFGRIYWGENRGRGLTEPLADLLEAQRVQDPFQLDISWLCVGHVDEFSSFVPDPSAPKGFRLVYADTTLARSFLESLDPSTSLPRYRSDHGYSTIGDLLDDNALWAANEDMQADYLDPNLEIFKTELGLDEADIVRIPGLFEESDLCGGGALSLIPGTTNLVVADAGEGTQVFLADPFLRTDDSDQGADPFIAEVASLLPSTLELNWLDDWDTYHLQWGEVHCGSNTVRPPARDWWTDAKHLLEGE